MAANASDANDASRLVRSFTGGSQGSSGVAKWKSCCLAAVDCCRSQLSTDHEMESSSSRSKSNNITSSSSSSPSPLITSSSSSSSSTCPTTWDGWTCWPKTPSNSTALARCPNYIYFGTESPPCNRKLQFRPSLSTVAATVLHCTVQCDINMSFLFSSASSVLP